MTPINFPSAGYSNKISFSGSKQRNSFDLKYKQKKNSKTADIVGTGLLMTASAFLAYKNKDKISQIITNLKKSSGSGISIIKEKFPNLSNAGSSLKEACKTPLNLAKKAACETVNFVKDKVK